MNKIDRTELQKAIDFLNQAKEIIDSIQESEEHKFGNLPDGIQYSERGQKFEHNAYALQEISESIESNIDNLTTDIL